MTNKQQFIYGVLAIVISIASILLPVEQSWADNEEVNAAYYDNTAATYTGSWTHSSGWSRAYNQTVSYTNAANSKLSFTFAGSSITRVYGKGFNRGTADIYIDGSFKETLNDLPAVFGGVSTPRWQVAKTWQLSNGGTHTIEVRRLTGITDADAFITDILTVGSGIYDTDHAQIKYIGTWSATNTSFTASYGSTLRWTNIPENAVSFTFIGDSVTYIFTKGPNRGYAAITIDGVDKGHFDMFANPGQFQQGLTFSGLGAGIHTIHVAVANYKNPNSSNYYIDVDAFKVGSIYNRTAASNYADTWAHARNGSYPNFGNNGDNNCNDCTNFISQVLEAGGMPQIRDGSQSTSYYWYVYVTNFGFLSSETWRVTSHDASIPSPITPSIQEHAGLFPWRYRSVGDINSLDSGDFFLVDTIVNNHKGADHANVIMGWGWTQEPTNLPSELNLWRILRNAHCNDRKRVRWDYGFEPSEPKWFYHVVY